MTEPANDVITVVSGLPRSGTSMMMGVLESAGLRIFTDGIRAADPDNPRGYYEFERVKKLETDKSWVSEARGTVVKVISQLLRHLPTGERYRVVFMRRSMPEVLASQREMLARRGQPADSSTDARMAEVFERHLRRTEEWLAAQAGFEVLYVDYNAVVRDPAAELGRVNRFLGGGLDEKLMAAAVDKALHRQRA
ncbi:MAG: sulfotransferase [Candidatus Binatia bacterium]